MASSFFKSLLKTPIREDARGGGSTKNANPRGCEGQWNALFVRADHFVLHAGSALVRSEQDLAASPIFRGVGLQSIEPQKSNRSFVFQKNSRKDSTLRNGGCALPKFVQL
jgi:hypothetical protein